MTTPGMHLQDLILDTKVEATPQQKADCLSLLKIVVKNLADPQKCDNPKYRQLRLDNEKVKQKLLPCPSAIEYLKAIGFVQATDDDDDDDTCQFLRIPNTTKVDTTQMDRSLLELTNALKMVGDTNSAGSKKPSSSFADENKTDDISTTTTTTTTTKLSEKQKARILLEKKRKVEAQEAKVARAKNVAMLKADKHTRMHDPNWKSGVSAACVKSGTGISTFRDKFGEN